MPYEGNLREEGIFSWLTVLGNTVRECTAVMAAPAVATGAEVARYTIHCSCSPAAQQPRDRGEC